MTTAAADAAHVWHPYAPVAPAIPPYPVLAARGSRLTLDTLDGPREVVDGMASWWCMVHGYRHPVMDAAVHAQVDRFSHVMFGGLTHEPAARLCATLADLAPEGLTRVFLADSGSVAMEVALKLARQVQQARGQAGRTRIAALIGGYHGDTLGAMSVCDPRGGMHALYSGAVPEQVFLPRPPAYAAPDAVVAAWVDDVRAVLDEHRDELAAICVEPLLQGAGGMWAWSPAALRALRTMADERELLLIADEIATGFGRTGTFWACEQAGIVPDVLAVGKALTGGYMTQAAMLTTEALAQEVSAGPGGALMHGPTFMANPLACAASLASLSLLATGAWEADVARIRDVMTRELAPLRSDDAVADVRILGGAAAVELREPVDLPRATRTAVAAGAWLRPFGRLVYAMPPYISTEEDLVTIAGAIRAVVTEGSGQ